MNKSDDLASLIERLEEAKPGWLPISGHVVNITFTLKEREVLLAALRARAQSEGAKE